MTLRRQAVPAMDRHFGWQTMAEFELPSAPGNERVAMERVAEIVQPLGLPQARLARLKTAVAEASMNAMEHGNQYRADQPIEIQVRRSEDRLVVRIIDSGRNQEIPEEPQVPDLDAKLAGLQSPRGWGLFLIQSMVDRIEIVNEDQRHVVELYLELPPAVLLEEIMTQQTFEAGVRHVGPIAVIDLRGDIDASADEALEDAYAKATANHTADPVLLNFTEVGYINSTGIALIVGLLAQARQASRALMTCGLNDHYREIFQITRLSDYMELYRDEASAVREMTGDR
jgi:anti-anti-sigma factor